ncbi:copper resistance system multicopper oxidase [Kiloniella laminariae]|uniref:Copper resistance system multicopper oxidase n=1 Tax=Kiloniella laminariae TaxID=454162 RepID=A0ABT4LF09_9PROT|nr:copper resistance system multicopper oxidase [Kiloniella laminariae]MCZ4279680.1 copper resistance system multicopper oxidase [Kiloniella laminariae]
MIQYKTDITTRIAALLPRATALTAVVAVALAFALAFTGLQTTSASAAVYDLTVDPVTIRTGDFTREGIGYNGSSPGPVLRFEEGEEVTINVTNNLAESTSIHWHGLILPPEMDGVPGISFDGIAPGETFTYKFPIVQSGTYWFHSHSHLQEPDGAYGAIVITPKKRDPFKFDRDYVVQLTDAHPHRAATILRNLKMMDDYYNRSQRTLGDFFSDMADKGLAKTLSDRGDWGEMRMTPTDIEDLQGYTPLINGQDVTGNWTGIFAPGERVRLRFINSSAMAYFDIRIPGLQMTVVSSDGNNVQPVRVDEFRIAVAETFDVIVQPKDDQAYGIIAESMGRTAITRATLAPREGMIAALPELRAKPLLTMADMGMDHAGMDMGMDMGGMEGMDHSGMDMSEGEVPETDHSQMDPAKMDHSQMDHSQVDMSQMDHSQMDMSKSASGDMPGMDHSNMPSMDHSNMPGMDHSNMPGMKKQASADPFYAPGSGLTPVAAEGGKFLSYADLKAQKPLYEHRDATREIELRLTGNMGRYSWSINGVKYEDADPIRLQYGERVRFKFVNETMMTHPMHLHGMWSILDNGNGKWNPVKHTISIAPGTTVYSETEVDAPGEWAFHCHLTYHMATGMFRKIVVEGGDQPIKLSAAEAPASVTAPAPVSEHEGHH